MSLIRPVLVSPPAFDATLSYAFQFTVGTGGSQVTQNQLTIRDNATNTIVYQETQTAFQYAHILPASTLTNGVNYNATVSTFDSTGAQSVESIPIQFWCYTTPVLTFTNIPTGNIIPNASFNFQFLYSQAEGEKINSYVMNLYNSTGSLVSSSNTQYAIDGSSPYDGSYLFAGFEDSALYYIELNALTIQGSVTTTGRVLITVKYFTPSVYTLVELTNNCNGGYVVVNSHLALIEGVSNPSPPVYIDNMEVDLSQSGSWIKWLQGYNINTNFLIGLWFRSPNQNSTLFTFSNTDGQTITIQYREGYVDDDRTTAKLAYITVTATSIATNNFSNFVYSGYIPILPSSDDYCLWVTRVSDIYQVQFNAV